MKVIDRSIPAWQQTKCEWAVESAVAIRGIGCREGELRGCSDMLN